VDTRYYCLDFVNNRIRISYILEKAAATLGSIGLMIVITEQYVLPTIQPILPPQTLGMTFTQKVGELGWVLLDMIFPYSPPPTPTRRRGPGVKVVIGRSNGRFITLYLLAFYVIFECVLNVFAEVTRFADRGFYDAWWNSTTWDQVTPPLQCNLQNPFGGPSSTFYIHWAREF
jgi:sterol O-acyltransferase